MRDVEVLVVGAGPIGLMLAAELRLAGIQPLVVERQPRPQEIPKAGGLGGRALDLLTCRGLIDRFEEAGDRPHPAPRFPFGGVHVDLTQLADPPLRALSLPQARLERLLLERAGELGAEIARGHNVVGLRQDDEAVAVDVHGPEGDYQVRAAYVVGCDGSKSSVRTFAGIEFPGITYPEVHRLGHVTLPASVTLLDDGDLDIPGLGRLHQGFIQTARGTVGIAASSGVLLLSTVEEESQDYDDDSPLGLEEFRASASRVLGGDVPMGEPLRLSRWTFQARLAERYRLGRVLVAGDAAHLFPATGAAISVGMLDAANLAWKLAADLQGWASPALLDSYHEERHLAASRTMLQTQAQVALRRGHDGAADALREVVAELLRDEPAQRRIGAMIAGSDVPYPMPGRASHPLVGTFASDLPLVTSRGPSSVAELMHPARAVLLDLADRSDLRDIARPWRHRVDIHTASTGDGMADALLIRPDGWVAWAASVDAPINSAGTSLADALTTWFGTLPTDNAEAGRG